MDLSKTFQPQEIETKWYKSWIDNRLFEAKADSGKPPFTMVIPPPNVTSRLHIGHALGRTLEDVMARWRRMQGFETLWVPGTDHAGIATQTAVEKHLMATEGKRRTDYDRDDFLARMWKWREENGTMILDQTKRLGCSLDWSRCAFTMDAPRSLAVMRVFKRLFDDGFIVRGNYICNWDPVSQTALADDEVEYSDEEGHLWHIKYPYADGSGRFAVVATTRPETMLGDSAVAVNPKDERYVDAVGQEVILPLIDRRIPIIADDFVQRDFGSGMVKITPAHDPNDFQCGQRHGLPQINVMHPDARINELGGPYAGLDRYEARERIVADLKAQGLIERIEKHAHRVGKSYRSGAVIEPYLSLQWFVKIRPLASLATEAVERKEVRLVPDSWESTYFHWMQNVRDWCISRQLVWGHRIPVFYDRDRPGRMVCTEGEPPTEPGNWEQDPDVLDTWFSSWLWPLSTLGWPDEEAADLKKFYPTTLLVTGYDILFFWVARMIMAGYYCTGERPFKDVLLHGLVFGKSYYTEDVDDEGQKTGGVTYVRGAERDRYEEGEPTPAHIKARWEKMSKSKGNVMDPNDLIDEVGADALRYTLAALTSQHRRQIDLEKSRIIGYRNFINKLWNAARFTLMNIVDLPAEELCEAVALEPTALEDRWILSRLTETAQQMTAALEGYHFDRAADAIYHFIWDEFCDWYLELVKPRLYAKDEAGIVGKREAQCVLVVVLDQIARLLHPLCPFVTEEIWQTLKGTWGPDAAEQYAPFAAESICVAEWPASDSSAADLIDARATRAFAVLMDVIGTIRNVRGEMNIPPATAVDIVIEADDAKAADRLRNHAGVLRAMLRVASLEIVAAGEAPSGDAGAESTLSSTAVAGPYRIHLAMPAELLTAERERLAKEQERLTGEVARLKAKLGNESFTAKAPEAVVAKEQAKLTAAESELAVLNDKLAALK